MSHIRIEIKGVRSYIRNWDDLPDDHKTYLEDNNMWQSVENLAHTEPFLSDGVLWTGRIWAVCDQLEQFGHTVEVDAPDFQGKDYGWKFNMQFRPYQEEFVNSVLDFRYGVFQAPPGFGKTICSSAIIAACGRKTAFIVQAEEVLAQAVKKIGGALNTQIGQVGDGKIDLQPITAFTIQTLTRYLARDENGFLTSNWDKSKDSAIRKWFSDCEVVIIDEAHHAQAASYTHFLGAMHHAKILAGVTATPEVGGDRQEFLEAYLGPVHFSLTYAQCIDAGILVPLTFYTKKVTAKDFGFIDADTNKPKAQHRNAVGRQYQKVVKEYVWNNNERNMMGVDFARSLNAENKSCAIIVGTISHANAIKKLMPEAVIVTGKTKSSERDKLLNSESGMLMRKEVLTVISTVLDEGVDIASLDGVALMAGGKSMVKFFQRLRNSRSFDGETVFGRERKTRGHVFYPIDQCDFLRSHSSAVMTQIRKLVKLHHLNTTEEI